MGRDKNTKNNKALTPESDSKKKNQNLYEDLKNPGSFFLSVLVKPDAKIDRIYQDGQNWCIDITSPPIKGKANQDIIKFLSNRLHISRTQILLIRGETSHQKLFQLKYPSDIKISEEQIIQMLLKEK